jgi:hypothetical protein
MSSLCSIQYSCMYAYSVDLYGVTVIQRKYSDNFTFAHGRLIKESPFLVHACVHIVKIYGLTISFDILRFASPIIDEDFSFLRVNYVISAIPVTCHTEVFFKIIYRLFKKYLESLFNFHLKILQIFNKKC